MVGLYAGEGVAVVGNRHADTVHQHVGDLIALAGGDGEGLVLTLVHCYAAGGSNAAACARLCGDGVGLRFQFRAGGGAAGGGAGVVCFRLFHADIAGVLGAGLAVGLGVAIRPSRAVKAVLRALHRRDGGRQGLVVAVPSKCEGKFRRCILIRLGDGDRDIHRFAVGVVCIALDIVPDGVLAHVDAGGDRGGVVAAVGAVLHGAAGDGACRHQVLGLAVVGQASHGGGGAAGSRFLNGQGQFAAGGGVVILGRNGGFHGIGAHIGGQAVGEGRAVLGFVLISNITAVGFIVHQGDGGGGDGRRTAGVAQGLAFPVPGQGGGSRADGVAGLLVCRAGVVCTITGNSYAVAAHIDAVAAVGHGVVGALGQCLVAQLHGDGGLLALAVVGKAALVQGHGGAGDVRWLRRGIRVIAVSIFVNAVDGAVGAVQHGVVVIRLVVIQVLVPGKGFTLRRGCSPAVEQPGHLAGGEVIGSFDHGVCRVGGKLALALVGAAGQVIAVADRGLGALVLAHDGAHIVGAIRRNGAGVVAVADVDPAVVAVAQDAAHAAGAAHINRNAALVGAVLNGAGADVAHDTGHAARGHRNGDFAGVDAVFHRGAAVLGHGAHHAADVVVAGADGDVHPADHAADGAARRSGAQGADRAAHFRNGFIAGDGDAAGDGEVFDGAGDIAEQAGIAFGVFDGHTADGIALAVKGAGVGGALAADRGPGLAAQVDVRSQHRAGARILLRAVGQGAIDQPGEPEQLERIGHLIAALGILRGTRRAAGTFAILTEAVLRGEGFFDGLAALFRGGDGVGTAVQRDFAFRKGKRPAIGGEGVAEHRGAGQDDLLLVVGTGHVIGYLDARYSDGGKAAVALQAAAAGQAGFGGDGQRALVGEGAVHGQGLALGHRQGAARRDGEGVPAFNGDILFQGIVAAHGAGLAALAVDQPAAVAGGGQRILSVIYILTYHTVGQQGGAVPDGHGPCAAPNVNKVDAARLVRRFAPGGEGAVVG